MVRHIEPWRCPEAFRRIAGIIGMMPDKPCHFVDSLCTCTEGSRVERASPTFGSVFCCVLHLTVGLRGGGGSTSGPPGLRMGLSTRALTLALAVALTMALALAAGAANAFALGSIWKGMGREDYVRQAQRERDGPGAPCSTRMGDGLSVLCRDSLQHAIDC